MKMFSRAESSLFGSTTRFRDRTEAGGQLARRLMHLRGTYPVVLALPRGGVPVGYEVARALGASAHVAHRQSSFRR